MQVVLTGQECSPEKEDGAMAKKIGIGLVVLLLGLAVAIATRPDTFRVERSAVIDAPPEVVYGYVNDFHQWNRWSPFEKLDPAMTRTYGGTDAGVGAVYSWSGNSQAGQGSMSIKASTPGQRIALDLHFQKPMESHALTEFTFQPTPQGTKVTWAMSGPNTTLGKAISLVASMDKMVGKSFEEGLSSLKTVSEAEAARRAAAPASAAPASAQPATAAPSPKP
jgi:uncharacterized protein YndB with AHSA1/START domain